MCLPPILCCRRRRASTLRISAPAPLRPGKRRKQDSRSPRAGRVPTTLSAQDLDLLEEYKYRARVGSWLNAARQGEGSPDGGGDVPLRNLLGERHPRREPTRSRSPPGLCHAPSRDYISLRSGTPLSLVGEGHNGHTPSPPPPPPPPPRKKKSIHLVGPCSDGDDQSQMSRSPLFTPLPLEIDLSPFDVEFRKLVMDAPADQVEEEQHMGLLGSGKEHECRQRQGQVQLGKGTEAEDSSRDTNTAYRTSRSYQQHQQQPRMPSRPKLVHFATTPSFSRRVSSPPVNEQLAANHASRSSYTNDHYRPVTPIRNPSPPQPPSPSSAGRRTSSSSHKRRSLSNTFRSSIQRDLVPILQQDNPPPPPPLSARHRHRQQRTSRRPDPALFPGVIPYAFSPRDVGLRRTEQEWRRFNEQRPPAQAAVLLGDGVGALPAPGAGTGAGEKDRSMQVGRRRGKRWSWSGMVGRRDGADERVVRQWLAESEGEGERSDEGWEVLRDI